MSCNRYNFDAHTDRLIAVLEEVSNTGPCTLADLNRRLPFPRAAIWRAASTLKRLGWIRSRRGDNAYEVVANQAMRITNGHLSHPEVDSLADILDELECERDIRFSLAKLTDYGTCEVIEASSASLYSQRRISPLIDAQAICALAAVTSASAFDRHLSAAIKRGNREEILDHDSGIFSARLQKLKIAGYLADEEHGSFCFPILRSGIIGCSIKINALNPDVPGSFEACKAVALRVMRLVDDEKVNAIRSDRH